MKIPFWVMILLALSSCENSQERDACWESNDRMLICNPHTKSTQSVTRGKHRESFKDVPEGVCEDETGSGVFEVAHTILEPLATVPASWIICTFGYTEEERKAIQKAKEEKRQQAYEEARKNKAAWEKEQKEKYGLD